MSNTKKSIYIIASILVLVAILGGITYAWFNYRNTTSEQQLIAGDIYLRLNEGQDEIELSNIFPETAEEARARDDNYITFEVTGKNTSNKTVYYEIILNHGETLSSPKSRYNDEDLRFDLVEIDGNNETYLLSAASYETLVNRRIYVNTINSNTSTEVGKHYLLRMWLDENVIISDTASDKTYTSAEYPNKYATIKLSVAGDFSEKEASKALYTIMSETAVMDNIASTYVTSSFGINFGEVSSDTNGKGVYTRAGTENDTYPIMYYRGAVEDNNVLFNNICWKAVRTTETGGVKLIYNGELSTNKKELTSEDYGTPVTNTGSFTYDSTDNTWNATVTSSSNVEITFNVPVAGNYRMIIKGTYGSGSLLVLKDEGVATGTGGPQDIAMVFVYDYGALTTSNKIGVRSSASAEHPYVLKVKVEYEDSTLGTGCNNMGTSTGITVNNTNTFAFNTSYNSPAYNGYMYGDVYTYTNGVVSGAYYDSTFIWDGTNYKLTDNATTTKSNDRHYSCGEPTKTATCASLRYYYYNNYYITLTGGDGVEEALVKMQTNTNDSNAKDKIETWYGSQMNTVTGKLEDTIWCNDRSFGDGNNNGWIANGGSLTTYLYYGASERSNYAQNTSTVKNQPSLACANKNDRFTWKNTAGNGALDYPVGMLTEDEMVLAGGVAGKGSYSYLSSGSYYWSLSPSNFFFNNSAYEFRWNYSYIYYDFVNYTNGLRPAVSLKPGTPVVSGTGTVADPYVIE